MSEVNKSVMGSNEWLNESAPRVSRGEAMVYAALLAIAGGAAGAGVASHLTERQAAFEQGVRAENLAFRVDGFTGSYNRFVAALGEEAPDNGDQVWLDGHNYRVEIAQRGLRGLCTRSDEATWLDTPTSRDTD